MCVCVCVRVGILCYWWVWVHACMWVWPCLPYADTDSCLAIRCYDRCLHWCSLGTHSVVHAPDTGFGSAPRWCEDGPDVPEAWFPKFAEAFKVPSGHGGVQCAWAFWVLFCCYLPLSLSLFL